MKTLGYYNGKYDEIENMVIPMNDRVCWFGDGVYDAGPAHNYKIYAVEEHIDRFFNSAGMLDIHIPMSKADLKDLIQEMVNKMDSGDLFVYVQCTRGTDAKRNHIHEENEKGNLWITLTPAKVNYGLEPITLSATKDTRFFHCNIKTLNLIPSVMAAQKSSREGTNECIFYRPGPYGDRVTECAHSNCHIIKDGKIITAPADNLILPGISRAHIIRMGKKLGIPVAEIPYTMDELMNADEVLISSSSNFVLRATKVAGQPVGGKAPELFEKLRKALTDEFKAATEN
jgi:D-alanine transaminase